MRQSGIRHVHPYMQVGVVAKWHIHSCMDKRVFGQTQMFLATLTLNKTLDIILRVF